MWSNDKMMRAAAKAIRAARVARLSVVSLRKRAVFLLVLALIAVLLGVFLLARSRGGVHASLPRNGVSLWLGVAAFVAVGTALVAVGAGRLLLLLLPLAVAATLLAPRRRRHAPDAAPADVVETEWFRAFREQTNAPMDAIVQCGSMSGRQLSELTLADLVLLHQQIDDDGSLALLERFLNQEFPGWRDRIERAAATLINDPMTPAKAREILGIGAKAGADEIVAAHDQLMKRLRPDRGGSRYLAKLLNRAKSVLLGSGADHP
jgi:hypothetical protein